MGKLLEGIPVPKVLEKSTSSVNGDLLGAKKLWYVKSDAANSIVYQFIYLFNLPPGDFIVIYFLEIILKRISSLFMGVDDCWLFLFRIVRAPLFKESENILS